MHPLVPPNALSRRTFFAAAAAGACASQVAAAEPAKPRREVPPEDYRIQRGRIKQSVYTWCFAPMPAEQLIRACHRMGIPAMDAGKENFPLLKQLGMKPAMVGSHGFDKGPFARANHDSCMEQLRAAIDLAAEVGSPNVITFTGYRVKGTSDEQGARNCVEFWKQAMPQAEKKRVTLCLEILNTRDDTHPMKGHPGYFGDDVDRCIDLIRRVDSPRMKLLFDVYHAQVMNGDVIRRIRKYHDLIGHYHVAGVPGRNEPDETQEVNYPAVLQAILDTGYAGYVSQEFIPTWPDKLAALRYAVRLCDI
jgi:hydroxypyruvate isomerase